MTGWRAPRNWLLGTWSALAIGFLLAPIAVVVVFGFNDPQGRFNFTWQGFTLEHWRAPFENPDLTRALVTSLQVAGLATALATVLGTLLAIALIRHRFRGRRAADMFVFLPMATPEVVLGASLLALFLVLGVNTGFWTIVIAHAMFTVSYVVVTVKARLEGMDPHVEEAAQDLGANGFTTLLRITLPMIAPGVISAAVLGVALSLDDYVVTVFNAGQTTTFPLFIFGAARQGVPPTVNVMATMLMVGVLALMALNVLAQKALARRAHRRADDDPPASADVAAAATPVVGAAGR